MTKDEFTTIDKWFRENPEIKGEFTKSEEPGLVDLKLTSKTPKGFEYVFISIEIEPDQSPGQKLEKHSIQ